MSRVDVQRLIPKPTSRFINVVCTSCGNRQVIFEHAKTRIQCRICGQTLAEPRGGKARVLGKVVEVLD
ncbi:MAG: 30S ribosomal protein S27e [Aigarchaeota archaeon]|nr:30S ribosomal protein S27e [Aigarchaeota archaeon]MDW8092173.1 30S ribosomal protein S27e [Nitrososphaerota archaeon]